MNAENEDAALGKIRSELELPYALLGRWETTAVDAEVTDTRPRDGEPAESVDGPLLLSVTEAAERVGIARATMYRLIDRGALEYVQVGRRRLVSRDALRRVIHANTRVGP